MVSISDDVEIDDGELRFSASRSSGPGGQNVNKVATRVTLRWDLEASAALSAEQKTLVRERLPTRLTKDGVLWVNAQRERRQSANRRLAVERFAELLRQALEVPEERRATRVPKRARRRRLEEKRQRGQVKRQRTRRYDPDNPE